MIFDDVKNPAIMTATLFGRVIFPVFFFLSFLPFGNVLADQSSLYLSPASGSYQVGSYFSVFAVLDGGGNPVNAAEGTVKFDPNKLSVSSVSKTGSVFSLWTGEPVFSNTQGTVSFGGGTPSAFSGSAGNIIKIVFRAKSSGRATVDFSSGSVLAADGRGTNILGEMSGGVYDLESAETKLIESEPEEPAPAEMIPDAPVIFSKTHPNQEEWYGNTSPEFFWDVPDGVTALRLSVSKDPDSLPDVFYSSPIKEKKEENIGEGIWYFNVQFKNSAGWGRTANFKFQTDLKPPEPFLVVIKDGLRTSNIQPTAVFEAVDQLSGIDHYEVKIDQGEPVFTKEKEFKFPPQSAGKHKIEVAATDGAGNSILSNAEIEIFLLEAPEIKQFPADLYPGNPLLIAGTSFPNAVVKIFIQNEKTGEIVGETKADSEGKWYYIDSSLSETGTYGIFTQAFDEKGGKSQPSGKIDVIVTAPLFLKIGDFSITWFAFSTLMIVFLSVFSTVFVLNWRKRIKRVRREVSEAEETLKKSFDILREEVKRQVEILDGKKGLSSVEQEILDNLTEAVKISEAYIGEELKDINKEL